MKVYFAGSIRGGREDRKLYQDLILYLRNFGEVLTEHVGDRGLFEKEQPLSDEQIYMKDRTWLEDCDILVAEVTTPSLGVGYEIGLAESLGKKILCLFRKGSGRKLSAMISGNPRLHVESYHDLNEAQIVIENSFK
jgi:nucleoside 2-deoxyribosyltransferase